MGSKDIILKPYLADNNRFADLVNVSVFQGRKVILPEQLEVQDSVRTVKLKGHYGKKEVQRTSDVIKKAALGTQFVVISLENQNDIHYAMPIRNLVSEAADYQRQYDFIRHQHEQNRDLNSMEYLSGFSKMDRIIPVITIVLYLGEEKWNGATDLYGMMGMENYPPQIREQLKKYINNNHVNLLDIRHMDNTDAFQTDLKQVFNFIKRDRNKKELKEYISSHRAEYEKLTSETIQVIEELSGFQVKGLQEKKEEIGGKYSMCRAIEEMLEDAREEGRQEMSKAIDEMMEDAREEGRQEMSKAIDEMIEDAREEGRQEMSKAIDEMIEDAREEGRQEMSKAIDEMMEDAREEGRQEMSKAIDEMIEDAREEGRQEILQEILVYAKNNEMTEMATIIEGKMESKRSVISC